MLLSSLDGEPYFAAGVPWYATLFGRDSLIAALQVLAFAPEVAAGTLRLLAAHGSAAWTTPSAWRSPARSCTSCARARAARRWRATTAASTRRRCSCSRSQATGDAALQAELRPAADAARAWIARRDPLTYTAGALRHQGWKDSEDGVPAPYPVALIEPQAYAGRDVEPFWLPDRGFYAMALGSDALALQPGPRAVGAGPGRLPAARARAIRDALMGPAMFSGWGIRTLAADEPLYDPLSYHRGSVWPHDTALIAAGLRRHGFDDDFLTLFDALVDAAALAPGPPPARAVRRPAARGGRAVRALPRRLPAAGVGGGRDPVPARRGPARTASAAAARRGELRRGRRTRPDGARRGAVHVASAEWSRLS